MEATEKMKTLYLTLILIAAMLLPVAAAQAADNQEAAATGGAVSDSTAEAQPEDEAVIVDPFEPLNRVFFVFNDKLYFILLKPVSQVYGALVPEWGRVRVRNVFTNAAMPVRFVNSLLQLKVHAAVKEVGRFVANSIGGVGGMFDVVGENPDAQPSEEDLGQTLGSYGIGDGFYIVWPVIGPSSFRDSVGLAGDFFLNPVNHITPAADYVAVRSGEHVNDTSLRIGEYEDFTESAVDPYVAMRDAYVQHRKSKVKE